MNEFGAFGEVQYVALIGNVVESGAIEDRIAFQTRLRSSLAELNEFHRSALAGDLALLRGDEIQALFQHPEVSVDIVVALEELLHPHQLFYGLGRGELTTGRLPETAQMDGVCFQNARNAWLEARRRRNWLVARGFDATTDEALTAMFRLMQGIRRRWTARQNQIVRLARTRRQNRVALDLAISPSVVSESLKAASFTEIRAGERAAASLLKGFAETGSY